VKRINWNNLTIANIKKMEKLKKKERKKERKKLEEALAMWIE